MTDPSYRWATPQEWLKQAYFEDKIKGIELLNLCLGLDADTIQNQFESAMDADGYFDETFKPAPGFEENSHLWRMIFNALKIEGNFEDTLSYMSENLTAPEYYEIEHFFDWLTSNDLTIGHGNYRMHYKNYVSEKSDSDEDENSHRREEGYCNSCAGDCQYDDQGNFIGDS